MLTAYSFNDWLAARKGFIGASESAAILGANPYRNAYKVYASKVLDEHEDENAAMRAGIHMEAGIARLWAAERPDMELIAPGAAEGVDADQKLVWQVDGSPMACTPDYFAQDIAGEYVVEIKNCDPTSYDRTWKEGPPLYYVAQVQHQIGVLRECGRDISTGWLVAYFGGANLHEYEIPFDQELYELMKRKCEAFWMEHVLPKIPPDADQFTSADDIAACWRKHVTGKAVEVPAALVVKYVDAKTQLKIAEDAADQAKAALLAEAKDAEIITTSGGVIVATWKTQVAQIPAKPAREQTSRPLRMKPAAQTITL